MQVHRNLDHLPLFRNAVITIGTFDGVHTGHQQIIHQLKDEAARLHGESVIITFDPHPRKIIDAATRQIKMINTLEEKIELLNAQGIDHLVIVPFTAAFSQLTAEQYAQDFLINRFHPLSIIIGYDHRFGKERKGDYRLLEEFSERNSYILKEIPAHLLNAISVSSTRIREAIINADIAIANELLGYPFFFEGKVVQGNKLGKTIGYPTANLRQEHEEKLVPGGGVYAVGVELLQYLPGKNRPALYNPEWKGMMNIGVRPTLDGSQQTIEVNIFNFNGDLYGKNLRIYVKKWLRAEQKFNGLDGLKEQLEKDKKEAAKV